MRDYYLWTWYARIISQVTERLKILQNEEIQEIV